MDETIKKDDLDILEDLRNKLYEAINMNESQTKVGDLLKVIELKRKLSVEGKGEKRFWDMVNKIRQEELTKAEPSASQIKKSENK
jgi:hypothetical protein